MKITPLILMLSALSVACSLPTLSFYQSVASYGYSDYPNDSCSKLVLTNSCIHRLGSNNVITTVNKSTLLVESNLLNYSYTLANGAPVVPNLILDFDIDLNETYLTISQATATRILFLKGYLIKSFSVTAPFYKILFNNLVLSGTLQNANSPTDLFYQNKYTSATFMASPAIIFSANYSLPNVKNCKSQHSPDRTMLVYWDEYSNVYVFSYANISASPVFLGAVASTCTVANLTQTIAFSSDSQYFILEADNQMHVQIVSVKNGNVLVSSSFPFNASINKAMFFDSRNAYIALFNNTAVTYIDAASLAILYSATLSLQSHLIEIDYAGGQLYVCKNSTVQVYNSSVSILACASNCQTCINATLCLTCSSGYALQNGICINQSNSTPTSSSAGLNMTTNATTSNLTANASTSNISTVINVSASNETANSSFSSIAPSPSMSPSLTPSLSQNSFAPSLPQDNITSNTLSDATALNQSDVVPASNASISNSSLNDTLPKNTPTQNDSTNSSDDTIFDNETDSSEMFGNGTFLILIMPDGSIMIFQITQLESQLLNNTQQALKYSNSILEQFMVFLSSSPYIYLCLSNLQFFTISSLYALLNVPLPQDLYDTLQATAAALSSNLFTLFNITLAVPALGEERVNSERPLTFGVSTLFLLNNYQYFILSAMAILVLYGMRVLLQLLRSYNKVLYLLLDHNKAMVIFGLIVSGMGQIILPYTYVYQNCWSFYFLDKINQAIQFLFFGMMMLFAGLYIAFVAKKGKGYNRVKTSSKDTLHNERVKESHNFLSELKSEHDNIYLILLNLFFPLLVGISQPMYFLCVNQLLLLVGFYKATLASKFRTNKIMLSIYPILFHTCFIIFNFSKSPFVLIITEISCILVYFLGSLHELITIIVSFLHFIYRLIRAKLVSNKIAPQILQTTQNWHWKMSGHKSVIPSAKKRGKLIQGSVFKPSDESARIAQTMITHSKEGEIEVYKITFASMGKKGIKKQESAEKVSTNESMLYSRKIYRR